MSRDLRPHGGPPAGWQLPAATTTVLREKRHRTAVIIPVLNEGERILKQLRGMQKLNLPADIVICDGGSTDGCTSLDLMRDCDVRALIVKQGPGKMSAQLRLAMAYAVREGYEFIINIDGNNKDGYEFIPFYIEHLERGYDLVLGSRYLPGGLHEHTPASRTRAIRWIHAPLISLGAGRRMTDTTNSFRGYNRRLLLDPRVQPFRDVFQVYNLPYYLAVRASRLGYRIVEIPVRRSYPADGTVPSKIQGLRGKLGIIKELLLTVIGAYNP